MGAGNERLILQLETKIKRLRIANDLPRTLVVRENPADDLIHAADFRTGDLDRTVHRRRESNIGDGAVRNR